MAVLKNDLNQLIATVEAEHPNDNTESVSLGLEYGFRRWIFLRCGYQSLFEQDSEKGLTLGMGLVYHLSPIVPLHFDYAYADWGRLITAHRFSVEIGF